jgi:hypothetical protein
MNQTVDKPKETEKNHDTGKSYLSLIRRLTSVLNLTEGELFLSSPLQTVPQTWVSYDT